jgi:DNA-binding transcriptional ArsR family regulator
MLKLRTSSRSPAAARPARQRQDTARRPDRPDARGRQVKALVDELSGAGVLGTLRLSLLRTLDQFGPQTVTEIPRAWPVTRQHVRRAIRSLADDGLLELRIDGSGSRTARLTHVGRRVLDEIDWTETIRSMERDGEL